MSTNYGTRHPADEAAADRIMETEKPGAKREVDGSYTKDGKTVGKLGADPNSGSLRLQIEGAVGNLNE